MSAIKPTQFVSLVLMFMTSLLLSLLLSPTAEATFKTVDLRKCQWLLQRQMGDWVQVGAAELTGLVGRDLKVLDREIAPSDHINEFLKIDEIETSTLVFRLEVHRGSYGLRLTNGKQNRIAFLRLGSAELVSHTEALHFVGGSWDQAVPVFRNYSSLLYQVFPVRGANLDLDIVLQIPIEMSSDRLFLKTRSVCQSTFLSRQPDAWFNSSGQLLCLKTFAVLDIK